MSTSKGGIAYVKVNGSLLKAVGAFTYNLGNPKREALLGSDGVHGYSEKPQTPYIAGEIRDDPDMDVAALQATTDATVTLELNNGKVITLRNAWYAGEGTGNSEEAKFDFRFEGLSAEEVK